MAAGTINTVVGSGSLITFPILLTLGYPPVLANVSNNIGLVPGAISGVYGYRRELVGQRGRILRLAPVSALGSLLWPRLISFQPLQTHLESIVLDSDECMFEGTDVIK